MKAFNLNTNHEFFPDILPKLIIFKLCNFIFLFIYFTKNLYLSLSIVKANVGYRSLDNNIQLWIRFL